VVDGPNARPGPISDAPLVYFELWGFGVLSGRCLERWGTDFELVEGSRRIDVRTAELTIERDRLPCARRWMNKPESFQVGRALLRRHALDGARWYQAGVLQLVEFRIGVGDEVTVWGRMRSDPAAHGEDASYRQPPRAPVLEATSMRHQTRAAAAADGMP
jgi:hypothetical protein